MLVTVPTAASKKLTELLSEAQKSQATGGVSPQDGYFRVLIQVLGAQTVYVDFNAVAATTTGVKILQNESVSFATDNLGKINLIANAADNTDVRILIN